MTDTQDPPKTQSTASETPLGGGVTSAPKPSTGPTIDKLKELELSLAKELDQHVRLSEPSDPRLEGGIDVNPKMEDALLKAQAAKAAAVAGPSAGVAAAPPQARASGVVPKIDEASSAERKEEDISLEEVDDLLNQLDGSFKASLDEIKGEISKVQVTGKLESAPIGADYLKSSNKEDDLATQTTVDPLASLEPALPAPNGARTGAVSLLQATGDFGLALVLVLPRLAWAMVEHARDSKALPPKEMILGLPSVILPVLKTVKDAANTFIHVLTGYSFRTYAVFLVMMAVVGVLALITNDIVSNFRADKEKDPFLRNFNDVAVQMQVIPDEEDGEDLESPLKHPEYMVLIHRIVANLKPPNRRATPMVVAEFYIEASSQESAIEIHNRDTEVKDIIERVLEETGFDELDSAAGKVRLKVRIRTGINRILNHGSARRIFFKSLNISE